MMPEFDPGEVKVGNLKDEAKIIAKITEAKLEHEKEFVDKAALSAVTGKVALIGMLVEDEYVALGHRCDEREAIRLFLDKAMQSLGTATQIIGFNIHEFDLPFIVRRAWKLGLKIPASLNYGRRYDYWSDNFIDLRKVWLMGDRNPPKGSSSLDGVAKFFGIPGKKGDGKDFYKMSANMQLEYSEQDLRIIQELWRRMM